MTTSLGGASVLAKPVNEGVEGEGLGESRRVPGAGAGAGAGLLVLVRGLGDSGSAGCSGSSGVVVPGGSGGLNWENDGGVEAGRDGSDWGLGGSDGGVGRDGGNNGGGAGAGATGAVQSRAGDVVALNIGVWVELDARLGGSVQLSSQNTLGVVRAGTGDLNVEALRVVLGTVGITSTVHGDDLVTEDVVAGGKSLGDSGDPGVVVLDQVGGSPLLGSDINTSLVDLDPLEGLDISIGAVTGALGDVGKDGSEVRLGPGGPDELDLTTGLDGGRDGTGSRVLVAVDVGCAVGRGCNEAVVEVLSRPGLLVRNSLAVLLGVVVVELVARVLNAVSLEALDDTVAESSGGESANEGSSSSERHDEVFSFSWGL